MSKFPLVGKLRAHIDYKIRNTNTKIFNKILRYNSKPLLLSGKAALVFAPHQDDETLGCGGMIALKRSQGVSVQVVFLTNGCYGRPEWIKPEEIVQVRQQEAITALNHLGVKPSETQFLGYTDGSLANLTYKQRQQLIDHLVALLKSSQAKEVYVPHNQDGHPDHQATYQLVQNAIIQAGIQVELLQYPIWIFWYNLLPFHLYSQYLAGRTYRLSINSVYEQKKRAIDTYKSQLAGLPNGLLNSFFFPYEIFIES